MKPQVGNQQESGDSMTPGDDKGPSPGIGVGGENWHGHWAKKNPYTISYQVRFTLSECPV